MASPIDKANHLKNKTDLIRKTFNYPDTEYVIQDYSCALGKVTLGKMYITANFISFIASMGSTTESIPFRRVTEMKKDYTLFVNNAIAISTSSNNYTFGTFSHRDEAFTLLSHLWKNPPMFYDPPSIEEEMNRANKIKQQAEQQQLQQQQGRVKVDTESTKMALRLVNETRETGISTLNELSLQAEIIDNMENNLDNIHSNLDRSDKLLKGIESWGGAISNSFDKDFKNGNKGGPANAPIDRTLQVRKREEPALDIDILEKLANDSLVPAYIQMGADKFCILDINKNAKTDQVSSFAYDAIDSLVVRARPQHLDIRFIDNKYPRFRLASSYIQNVVNEIVLRSNGKHGKAPKVIFEPGVKNFLYGLPTIRFVPSAGRANQSALFTRTSNMGQSHLIKNATGQTKADLIEQDNDLDEISRALGDIGDIAKTITTEVVRSSEQLDRIDSKVDHAQNRLQNNNRRINNML
ncbi:hypothetical protein CYY_001364 [Polysphondylium violaceum]|uniref:Synaptosomal-associated protein 47 n=1 Tax=Polysphondylium violaceum TaxID=133409 RepID=A0A8J4Q099_9MYCE|nr:hypothetical protein CYY_001364 [Polysphondylium violaceum]